MSDIPRADLMTTGIGSLPFTDGGRAAMFVLNADLSIPFWPQLPRRHFREQMIPQFSEEMPCVRNEPAASRTTFDPGRKYEDLEAFYEAFLTEEPDRFPLSEEAAEGFYAFERAASGRTWPIVKGQVTGPITLTTSIASREKEPLYGDPELRDAAVKMLVRNAEWQIARLRAFASERVLIFVDEPVLAAFGSSTYLSISETDVCEMEGEVFRAIEAAGAMSGIHVCGNSDWGVVSRTGVQVLNFDAYQYGPTIALYPDAVGALFDRGGWIAWGIVPTTKAIVGETADTLAGRLQACFTALEDKGLPGDVVRERSLLTPSCGAGTLTLDDAKRVFDVLRDVKQLVREEDQWNG